jgi:hypothetical protein
MNSSLQDGAENAMSIRIGYLLPPRERITAGQPQAASLLELAERAERLGFDSVWANAPAIADLKATLADFRATLAELRITMAADKTQPLELPPRQRPWWPIRRVEMPALRLHDRAMHSAGAPVFFAPLLDERTRDVGARVVRALGGSAGVRARILCDLTSSSA